MGSFEISETNITGREKTKYKKPQITCLTATPSREVTQMLVSTASKQELNREVRGHALRVKTI